VRVHLGKGRGVRSKSRSGRRLREPRIRLAQGLARTGGRCWQAWAVLHRFGRRGRVDLPGDLRRCPCARASSRLKASGAPMADGLACSPTLQSVFRMWLSKVGQRFADCHGWPLSTFAHVALGLPRTRGEASQSLSAQLVWPSAFESSVHRAGSRDSKFLARVPVEYASSWLRFRVGPNCSEPQAKFTQLRRSASLPELGCRSNRDGLGVRKPRDAHWAHPIVKLDKKGLLPPELCSRYNC